MKHLIALLLCAVLALAQKTEFTGAVSMKSATLTPPSGTALPESCIVPQWFNLTTAAAGQNLYICTGTPGQAGTWTLASGAGGGGSSPVVITTGSGDPVATCVGPSSSNLSLYVDTSASPRVLWWCDATNTWKKLLDTTNVGPWTMSGDIDTDGAWAAPASGQFSCRLASDLTLTCKDSTDTVVVKAGLPPTDATIAISDVLTNNASTGAHGWLPKLSGNVGDGLRGDGTWGTMGTGDLSMMDQTVMYYRQDFLQNFSSATNVYLDFRQASQAGSTACDQAPADAASESGHPGILVVASGSTTSVAGHGCTIVANGYTIRGVLDPRTATWQHMAIVKISETSQASFRVGLAGLSSSYYSDPMHGIYARFNSADSDTYWTLVARSSIGSTAQATTVAATAGHWYRFLFTGYGGGKVGLRISDNGGAYSDEVTMCTAAGGCTVNSVTTMPVDTGGFAPIVQAIARDTTTVTAAVDLWLWKVTGLAR